MMKLLSDKSRDKFAKAARSVQGLVDAGTSPDEAIVKVAGDAGFSPDLTRRLCECYNIGQMYHRFRSFSDLDDKLASVPIVNREEAVKRLFPDEHAVEVKAAALASYSKKVPDLVSILKEPERPPIQKAASVGEEKPQRWTKLFEEIRKLGSHSELLSARSMNLGIDLAAKIRKTAALLAKSDSAFQDIDLRTIAALGKEADVVMDLLAERTGEQRADFEKFAGRSFAVNMHAEPFRSITECFRLSGKIKDVMDREATVKTDITEKAAHLLEIAPEEQKAPISTWLRIQKLSKRAAQPAPPKPPGQKKPKLKTPHLGSRAWSMIGGIRETSKGLNEQAKKTREAMEAMADVGDVFTPEHDSQVLRVKAQALLNQFLSADPVLSGMDPGDVIEAFNQVRDMRPELVLQPALLKGVIRTLLEQSQMLEPALAVKLIDKAKKEGE